MSVNREPTEEEALEEIATSRLDKVFDASDRALLRAWRDGFKYAMLLSAGIATTPTPLTTMPSAAEAFHIPVPQPSKPATFAEASPPEPQPAGLYEIPGTALPQGWRKVYHLRGEYPCGRPALIIIRPVYADEKGLLSLLRHINGTDIRPEDEQVCGSCRKPVHVRSNADLDWAPHQLPARRSYALTFADENPMTPTDPQPEPGQGPTGADPTYRHPASVLAEMHRSVHTPYAGDDIETPLTQNDTEAVEELYNEIGLPRPVGFGDSVPGDPSVQD